MTGPFDAIAHLACPASPDEYLRLPLETLAIGSHGSEFVLLLAKKNNCRVLLASTSEVYGDPLERPQREESYRSQTGYRYRFVEGAEGRQEGPATEKLKPLKPAGASGAFYF